MSNKAGKGRGAVSIGDPASACSVNYTQHLSVSFARVGIACFCSSHWQRNTPGVGRGRDCKLVR